MFLPRWIRTLAKKFVAYLSENAARRRGFGWQGPRPKARRPRRTEKPTLVALEDRVVPSATLPEPTAAPMAVVYQASPPAMPPAADLSSMAGRVIQLETTVASRLRSIDAVFSQEVTQMEAFAFQRLETLLGVGPIAPSQPAAATVQQLGKGAGTGSGTVMTSHNAHNPQPDTAPPKSGSGTGTGTTTTGHDNTSKLGIMPMIGSGSSGSSGSVGSLVSGSGSIGSFGSVLSGSGSAPGDEYDWDPLPLGSGSSGSYGNLSAGSWENWLRDGFRMDEENYTLPGYKPGDTVVLGSPLASNGHAPIIWDQNFTFSTMALDNYNAVQQIAAGTTVEVTGKNVNDSLNTDANSVLSLNFGDKDSAYKIDGNATITNLTLAGDKGGSFIIKGGTTTIANGNYSYLIGAQFIVAPQGTVQDWSKSQPLTFTQNELGLKVYGTMGVNFGQNAANTLIGTQLGIGGCYVDVNRGKLIYAGKADVVDTIGVPVGVRGGGTFAVFGAADQSGGKLIVKGSGGLPESFATGKISVAMNGATSSIQLAQKSTLECDNVNYFQTAGTLETVDGGGATNASTLQVFPDSSGTAKIQGGYVAVAKGAPTFGVFNVNGNMNLGDAQLQVDVNAVQDNKNDSLNVSKNLNINNPADSFLSVSILGTAQRNHTWTIITAGNQLAQEFEGGVDYPGGGTVNYNAGPDNKTGKTYVISC